MKKSEVFIGARSLYEKELERLLPNYKSINERIKDIRNSANNTKINYNNREYNNTISILGKRGTGKTSILYTLKERLEDDIVLPIIKPDSQSKHTILSNVLGHLKTVMEDTLKEIQQLNYLGESDSRKRYFKMNFGDYFKECYFNDNNPLKNAFIDMCEYYYYKDDGYKKILVDQYINFNNFVDKSSKILNADEMFIEHFHKFIDTLLDIKEKLIESRFSTKENLAPMLFILIDDADLHSTKIHEVVDFLSRYINNPRVVCMISADYDTFSRSLLMSLLRKEGLSNKINIYENEPKENSLFSLTKDLANDCMKKIMPSAFRYEIAEMSNINKAEYTFYTEGTENPQMMELFWEFTKKCGGTENIFFTKNDSGENEPLTSFFSVLDNTSSGLVNVYYNLYNATNVITEETSPLDKFILVKSIVDTIINSNPNLAATKNNIYKNYIIWGNDAESSRLEFSNLQEKQEKDEVFNIMRFIYHTMPELH